MMKNRFLWTEQKNNGRTASPLYFLILEGSNIFFVNNTDRIIVKVESLSSQAEVCDATGACFPLFGPFILHSHEHVRPHEAVLIAHMGSVREDPSGCSVHVHAAYLRKDCLHFSIPPFDTSNRHPLLQQGDKRYKITYAADPERMFLPSINRRT